MTQNSIRFLIYQFNLINFLKTPDQVYGYTIQLKGVLQTMAWTQKDQVPQKIYLY